MQSVYLHANDTEGSVCNLLSAVTEQSTSRPKYLNEQSFHYISLLLSFKEIFLSINTHIHTHVYVMTYMHRYVYALTHIHTYLATRRGWVKPSGALPRLDADNKWVYALHQSDLGEQNLFESTARRCLLRKGSGALPRRRGDGPGGGGGCSPRSPFVKETRRKILDPGKGECSLMLRTGHRSRSREGCGEGPPPLSSPHSSQPDSPRHMVHVNYNG